MEFRPQKSNRYQLFLNRIPVLGDVLRTPLGFLGTIIILIFVGMVLFAPYISRYGFEQQDIPSKLQGPSAQHWLGTDHLGRDLWARIVFGARIALGVAAPSVALALLGGLLIGLIAGFAGGWVDNIFLVFLDSIQAFPAVILALVILALLGPSLINVVLVIGLAWTPGYARVVRAQVLTTKQNQYIEVEQSLGATRPRILLFHILPNIIAPLLILVAMDLPGVITFEAGLSFLGLGVRPPTPSWGVILSDGFNFIRQSPWPIVWSGLTLIIITLGFTLFGESLRDVLDPTLSGKQGIE
jgi:peptide/nickel transport system permease protein